MRASYVFGVLLVSTLVAACSSSTPPKNVDSKGGFAFEGDGWTHVTSGDHDYWQKGAITLGGDAIDPSNYSSAQAWAEADYDNLIGYDRSHDLHDTTSLVDPSPVGSGYYFGWTGTVTSDNVYEAFYVDGKRGLHIELQGPALSKDDATAVLSTAQLL